MPEGLNTDGKKGNVQIKAVFKDATQVDQAKYYLALENVSYKDASEQEVANYKSGDKVVVDNVANAEYQGVFDDKAKETEDAKANLEQDAAKPVTPEQPKQTFAKTGVNDVAKYGFLAVAIGARGFLGFRKFKGSKQD